jgi:hypothetical protein
MRNGPSATQLASQQEAEPGIPHGLDARNRGAPEHGPRLHAARPRVGEHVGGVPGPLAADVAAKQLVHQQGHLAGGGVGGCAVARCKHAQRRRPEESARLALRPSSAQAAGPAEPRARPPACRAQTLAPARAAAAPPCPRGRCRGGRPAATAPAPGTRTTCQTPSRSGSRRPSQTAAPASRAAGSLRRRRRRGPRAGVGSRARRARGEHAAARCALAFATARQGAASRRVRTTARPACPHTLPCCRGLTCGKAHAEPLGAVPQPLGRAQRLPVERRGRLAGAAALLDARGGGEAVAYGGGQRIVLPRDGGGQRGVQLVGVQAGQVLGDVGVGKRPRGLLLPRHPRAAALGLGRRAAAAAGRARPPDAGAVRGGRPASSQAAPFAMLAWSASQRVVAAPTPRSPASPPPLRPPTCADHTVLAARATDTCPRAVLPSPRGTVAAPLPQPARLPACPSSTCC